MEIYKKGDFLAEKNTIFLMNITCMFLMSKFLSLFQLSPTYVHTI